MIELNDLLRKHFFFKYSYNEVLNISNLIVRKS